MNTLQRKNKKSTAALCDPGHVERRHVKRARLAPRHLLVALVNEDPAMIIAGVAEAAKATFLRNHYTQFVNFLAHDLPWDQTLLEMGTAVLHGEARERARQESAGNRLVDFYITSGLPVTAYVRGKRRRTGGRWEDFRTWCGHFLIRHQRAAGIRLEPVEPVPEVPEAARGSVGADCASWASADDTLRTCLWHELTDTAEKPAALTTACRQQFRHHATRGAVASARQMLGTWGLLLKKGLRESSARHPRFVHRSRRYDTICFKDCELYTQLDRRLYELSGPVSTHLGALASVVLSYC